MRYQDHAYSYPTNKASTGYYVKGVGHFKNSKSL